MLCESGVAQGLKPKAHIAEFAAWLKPCPCYKAVGWLGFSARCEAMPVKAASFSADCPAGIAWQTARAGLHDRSWI
jgi:hypothetical protein